MEVSDWIAIGASAISLISVGISFFVWKHAKKTVIYQAIDGILKEYKSSQMLVAVKRLWDLYKDTPDMKFVDEYFKIWNKENEEYNAQPIEKKQVYLEHSIHYQRRIVSIFYQNIAKMYKNKIIKKEEIYRLWSESDLQIIPKILMPINKRLDTKLQKSENDRSKNNEALQKLYDDSKLFEAK